MISKAEIEKAKTLLDENKVQEAIELLNTLVADCEQENKDVAYYVLGNAYRRGNNWQEAINSYSRAIEINPSSQLPSGERGRFPQCPRRGRQDPESRWE